MPIPSNHSKPVRLSAKENAFNHLQQWIIDGTLLPGEKLNDTELANALGTSRTPIRESLQLLEARGFVRMYPGKATQVTEIERDAIKDLLPPLAALQSLSAELAIDQLTENHLTQLESVNDRFEEAIQTNNGYAALKIDEEFHQIIVDITKNPYIKRVVEPLQAHVRRHYFYNSIVLTEKSIDDHKTIISAMKNGDSEEVVAVMKENWLRTLQEFR